MVGMLDLYGVFIADVVLRPSRSRTLDIEVLVGDEIEELGHLTINGHLGWAGVRLQAECVDNEKRPR